MKTILKLSLCTALLLLFNTCQREERDMPNDDLQLKSAVADPSSVEGRYIVVFKDQVGNPSEEAENLKVKYGLKKGHVYQHCLKGFSAFIPPAALEGLSKNPVIDYIEPDMILSISEQVVPTGIRRIAINTSPFAKIDGIREDMDVDVAVIDTGVDTDHPDLNVAGGVRYYNLLYTDNNYNDDHGHGSHVAGTIGAYDNGDGVVGVAPGARIWAVKVLSSTGSGYMSDIIKGIDWVKARAADIEVINMSIGGKGYSSSYRTAIANCVNAGIVVMVAAGNEATDVYGADGTLGTKDDRVPAAFPEAAAISALADSNGDPGGGGPSTSYGPDDSFASFSNYSRSVVAGNPVNSPGKAIDLLMPGVSIYSCYMNGGYATMSGTSMASPHAAGLAALYIAEHGRATNAEGVYAIRQTLIDRGKKQTDTEGLITQNDPDDNEENLGWVILNSNPVDLPPVAKAGLDQTMKDADGTGKEMVTLNGSASTDDKGIISWSWKENDVEIASGQIVNHEFSLGIHTVTLVVKDIANQTSGDEVVITVLENQAPTAGFSANISGLTVAFTDNSSDPDGYLAAKSWDFGDGNSSTETNPSHTYNAAGTYPVSLTVADNGGLTDVETKSITVTQQTNQPPVAGFAFNTSGLTANFTDTSIDTDGTISTWQWNFGDGGNSTSQNPFHTYASAGTYTVSLTVTDNQGSTDSDSKSVTVTTPPLYLTLTVAGYKVKNVKKADLRWTWSGTESYTTVNITRNGISVTPSGTEDDGFFTDTISQKGGGTFEYQVCVQGTTICSNKISVVF